MARNRTIKVTITGDAANIRKAFGSADKAAKGFGKTLKTVAGVAGIGGLVIAMQRAVTASVDMAIEFENSLTKIVGLVGTSREQVDQWADELVDLSHDTTVPLTQLGDTLYYVASSGIETADVMGVMEASSRAAAAGLGDIKIIADVATSAINAYGASNISAEQAIDNLVSAIGEGKAEPEEFAGALGRVIPVASELGIEFHEVAAAVASMSLLGLDAAEGVTALRGVMTTLLKPSKQAEKQLEEFGLTAQGLRDIARNDGVLAVLQLLRDTFGDNEEAIGKVFGNVRALAGVLNLVGANAENVVDVFEVVEGSTGNLDRAFEAMADTPAFALSQALNDLKIAGVELGSQILPAIAEALQELGPVLADVGPKFGELLVSLLNFGTSVGPLLGAAIDTVATALAGLAYIVNSVVGLWDEQANNAARWTEAMDFLNDSLEAGEDPLLAAGNAMTHLAANGQLTEESMAAIATIAGLTAEELQLVKDSLLANAEANEAAHEAQLTWIDGSEGVFEAGRAVRNEIDDEILVIADLNRVMNRGTHDSWENVRAQRARAEAEEAAGDAAAGAIDPAMGAADAYGAEADELLTLEERLIAARDAQQSLSDVMLAAASPVFAAATAVQNVAEAEERLAAAQTETNPEQVKSREELAILELEVAEAKIRAQAALDAVGDAEVRGDGIEIIGEAMEGGVERAEELLELIGVIDGQRVRVQVIWSNTPPEFNVPNAATGQIPEGLGQGQVPFNFQGLGLPQGSFAEGGVIPGPEGKPFRALVHGGEEVVSAKDRKRGRARITVVQNIYESRIGTTATGRRHARRLRREMDRQERERS